MSSIRIAILIFLAFPSMALAWGNRSAHPAINHEACDLFVEQFDSGGNGQGGTRLDTEAVFKGEAVTKPGWTEWDMSTGSRTLSFCSWMAHGGFSADEPESFAAWRHFYDPHSRNGAKYLTDHVPDSWLANPQIDAKTWALTHRDNPYSLEAARENYREAFAGTSADPGASFARAFRGVGETMHLLADMVQPAHVRNDAHAFSEPIEEKLTKAMVETLAAGELDSRVGFEGKSVPELFDELAVFTNEHFYSNDTIYNSASPNVPPANGQTPNSLPQFNTLKWDNEIGRYYGVFGSRNVPMVFQTLSSYEAQKNGYPNEPPVFRVASFYTENQAAVLVPLAVRGNAEIISQFFPKLTLKISKSSAASDTFSISGELVHEIGNGQAWATALKYSGPARLLRRTPAGEAGDVLAEATFQNGTVVSPVEVDSADEEEKVFWQIRVGGLIIESADLKLSGAEETFCPYDSNVGYYLQVCEGNYIHNCDANGDFLSSEYCEQEKGCECSYIDPSDGWEIGLEYTCSCNW